MSTGTRKKATWADIRLPHNDDFDWHPTKNGSLRRSDVALHSKTVVWWLCLPTGHAWDAPASTVAKYPGCPICSGQRTLIGFNDFASAAPRAAKEWHPTKNGDLNPVDVTFGSNKKVWWKCLAHGHEWQSLVLRRKADGARGSCPYCSGKKVLAGFNDLSTTNAALAAEWHPTRNDLTPTGVTRRSERRVWWLCSDAGHEWQASVAQRDEHSDPVCPTCIDHASSEIERRLRDWLKSGPLITNVVDGANSKVDVPWRRNRSMRVDLVGELGRTGLPVVVEYDGSYWHRGDGRRSIDLAKTRALLSAGYYVVRVRENDLGLLPLSDDNLFQVGYTWQRGDDNLVGLVEQIEAWIYQMLRLEAA